MDLRVRLKSIKFSNDSKLYRFIRFKSLRTESLDDNIPGIINTNKCKEMGIGTFSSNFA